jgi:hypothetical protein
MLASEGRWDDLIYYGGDVGSDSRLCGERRVFLGGSLARIG